MTAVHFFSDVHVGDAVTGGIHLSRMAAFQADLDSGYESGLAVPLDARAFGGDAVEWPSTANDNGFISFIADMPQNVPIYGVLGNHDTNWTGHGTYGGIVRTGDDAALALAPAFDNGTSARNWAIDLGSVVLIGVSGQAIGTVLDQVSLSFLDAVLLATSKPCWILCHAPLENSVLGDTTVVYSSAPASGFYESPPGPIRDILGSRRNAELWISGHTHSPKDTPGKVRRVSVGNRSIMAVNLPPLFYTDKTINEFDPLGSFYLTKIADDVEVRHRDHLGGAWSTVHGQDPCVLPPAKPYPEEVLKDDPAYYFRLGEAPDSTIAVNFELGGEQFNYVNTPTLGEPGALVGDPDTGVTFAAVSQEHVLGTILGLWGFLSSMTFEYWTKTTSTALHSIAGSVNTGATLAMLFQGNSVGGVLNVGKTCVFWRGANGAQAHGDINQPQIYDGNWHHVVWVLGGTSAVQHDCYVDGVQVPVTMVLSGGALTVAAYEFPWTFGAQNQRGVIQGHMTGSLDEVAMYPARLSADRIQAHWARAAGPGSNMVGADQRVGSRQHEPARMGPF